MQGRAASPRRRPRSRSAGNRRRSRPLDLEASVPRLEAGRRLGGGRQLDLRRVRRRGGAARPARAARGRRGGLGTPRCPPADARRRPQARPRPRRRSLRAPLRRPRVRSLALLADEHPRHRAGADEPGSELPGGLVAVYDGRGRNETPLWLPEQKALVFADALTAPGGELRVWATPALEERALPALRALLQLPFERVIVSHGEPVHDRAEFELALERPPWTGEAG
jgi:hypothetical protein